MSAAASRLQGLVGRLVSLSAGDLPELNAMREELGAVTVDAAAIPAAVTAIQKAIEGIIGVIMHEVADEGAALAEAARLVAEAAEMCGDNAPAAPEIAVVERPAGEQLPSFEALLGEQDAVTPALAAASGADAEATVPTAPARAEGPMALPTPAGPLLPEDGDRELLPDFLVEGTECLDGAERALLDLESNPADPEAINTVFRAFHTIKGTSAFMGLALVSQFAHAAESFLSRVRDHAVPYTRRAADAALRASDLIRAMLQTVQEGLEGKPTPVPMAYGALLGELKWLGEAPANQVSVLLTATEDERPGPVAGAGPAAAAGQAPPPAEPGPSASPSASPAPAARKARAAEGEQSIRVATQKLDRMIDMVGELVIAQSMVAQDPALDEAGRAGLNSKVQATGKIVRELQDLSLSMRMVPLAAAFHKAQRLARDVASKSGKLVEFVTEGEETEIDRNMVDVINDPLVHMIRNAIDHGVERPEERMAAGKARSGRVTLSAFHQGGNVVVQLRDDGRGLNRDKILAKAIEKGLVDPDKPLSDSEIYNLIFAAGFSTADQVTDLSGRGVGMDVVRRNIESLRGRVDIDSTPGQGAVFTIRLPLTLAITDGMLARVGHETYIVPLVHITMSFRPDTDMVSTVVGRGEVVLLRGELLPVLRLHQLFGIPDAETDPAKALCMIVADGDRKVALLVDELLGQSQVVAKPLGAGFLGATPGIAGGAILGNGTVGLILDVAQILGLARGG